MKQRELCVFPLIMCCALFVFACATTEPVSGTIEASEPVIDHEPKQTRNTSDYIQEYVNGMSLVELVGQLFIIDLRAPLTGEPFQELNPEITEIFKEFHPGGVILFGGNLRSPQQIRHFITDLQDLSATGLFVAIDEEGGPISRLNYSPLLSPGLMPSAGDIGATCDIRYAYTAGTLIARQLVSLGINMNNAPVADVLTNPDNPVIGKRSYGSDPELVGGMAAAFLDGLNAGGIIGVMKHFPGHGDTASDSHSGAVYVSQSAAGINKRELIPFSIGIHGGARAVMTGHITVPNVDKVPATFSRVFLEDILRQQLRFKGLVISDSLAMGAVTRYWSADKAAVEALKAGIDIILIPDDLQAAFKGVMSALERGELPEFLIREKVLRILRLKADYGILDKSTVFPDVQASFHFPEINEFRQEVLKARLP